jgi:hypothetical protein
MLVTLRIPPSLSPRGPLLLVFDNDATSADSDGPLSYKPGHTNLPPDRQGPKLTRRRTKV